MTVIITKQNKDLIEKLRGTPVTFTDETENSGHFEISVDAFQKLTAKVKEAGYNPYALLFW